MTFVHCNPRRTLGISIVPELFSDFKKSSTFHAPRSPRADEDPLLHIPHLLRRSPTSTPTTDDILLDSQQRISRLISEVDRTFAGLSSLCDESDPSIIADGQPLPSFMLKSSSGTYPDCMDIDEPTDKPSHNFQRHTSDSGLGSSVASSVQESNAIQDKVRNWSRSQTSVPMGTHSGINGARSSAQQLSVSACRQIQKHIILPILRQQALKKFHPLVTGIPVRVSRREITCLRDLEKILLFLAPVSENYEALLAKRTLAYRFVFEKRFTKSRALYLEFCETSIQCLHTTVDHLGETDQRRPSDRPYSNTYFLDLTEQVRRYATLISAARERISSGQAMPLDQELTYEKSNHDEISVLTPSRKSKLSLEGGFAQTGHSVELVHTTADGHSKSLATGKPVDLHQLRQSKEADSPILSDTDEDIQLSMARRRRTASERVAQRCSECNKEFKRPCDLTKHEKTHSRPWKCSEADCKYAQYGWPTEKERDRHINDKHSATPTMYKCKFRLCPYQSKRESNCKQHMEKTHGWSYVRSKNNGKSARRTTTLTGSPKSPLSSASPPCSSPDTSDSEFGGSSHSPVAGNFVDGSLLSARDSVVATSPELSLNEPFSPSPIHPAYDFSLPPDSTPFTQFLTSETQSPASLVGLDSHAMTGGATSMLPLAGAMNDLDMEPSFYNDTFDWSNMDSTYQNMNYELFTPAMSICSHPTISSGDNLSVNGLIPLDAKLSPGAHGAMMLYSPEADGLVADEGFEEFLQSNGKPKTDFPLFDTSMQNSDLNSSLFEGLPPFQSQTWAPLTYDDTSMAFMQE